MESFTHPMGLIAAQIGPRTGDDRRKGCLAAPEDGRVGGYMVAGSVPSLPTADLGSAGMDVRETSRARTTAPATRTAAIIWSTRASTFSPEDPGWLDHLGPDHGRPPLTVGSGDGTLSADDARVC